MAASALAAFADGSASRVERRRIGKFIVGLQHSRIRDGQAAIALLEDYLGQLKEDATAAETHLAEKIRAVASDRDAALLIARIVLAISQADDAFVYAEKLQFQEICALLDLDPQSVEPL